jgi:hypothetical protein
MGDDPNDKRQTATAKSLQDAAAEAIREKTARLRAMRLAHEAANPPAASAGKSTGRAGARAKNAKKPAAKGAPLSDWLSAQEQEGRRR